MSAALRPPRAARGSRSGPRRSGPRRSGLRGRAAGAAGLGERVVEEAWGLLAEEGLPGLTLRRIARRAGVTHGAPLRHFPSLGALLAEVAARGFRMLTEAVESAAAALPPGAGAVARLRAAGRAYAECAVANPGVFELMFRPELLDRSHPAYVSEGLGAFEQLVRMSRAAQDAGFRPELETRRLAGALWAAVHGLASLWVQGAFTGVVPATRLGDAIDTALGLVFGEAGAGPPGPRRARRRAPAPGDPGPRAPGPGRRKR
jgi:AcrR family transcriptional regulator